MSRRVFLAVWGLCLVVVIVTHLAITARYQHQLAIIQKLGGVIWQFQGDADDQSFAVRHPDGFFGLITVTAPSFDHFLLGLGGFALVASAIGRWRMKSGFGFPGILCCFMAPQLIVLAATISAGHDFVGNPFEMTLDPAAGKATGFDGTAPLCKITDGDAVPDGRSIDVDLTVNGGRFTLDAFRESSAAYGLLDEVAGAVRAGCPGNVNSGPGAAAH